MIAFDTFGRHPYPRTHVRVIMTIFWRTNSGVATSTFRNYSGKDEEHMFYTQG